jgi:predicted dehydrogenase/threonine dehydrogenase-like Zn-dependent dehydrogenase
MKQIVQSPRTGRLELVEVPTPACGPGQVRVRNHFSVVSPGTEKMAMDFARKSRLAKARSRPDLVKQVVRKLRQEGPLPTYRAVTTRLDAPQPLGYSCAGVVQSVGEGVAGFGPGDRVACAGAGYANHAEWVCVPENLVARVPDGVPLDKAAFATIGSIAMQGLRVAAPSLGETAVVIGLGLIGQAAVQLLRANGCRVLGIDVDPRRLEQGRSQGAEWCALPGDDHSAWIRRTFYEKELELRMSMSYGPGRYDRRYEELGLDYPMAYVRWTENRNLQAFLALTGSGAVDPERLDVQKVPFAEAEQAYEELARGERRSLAILFQYDEDTATRSSVALATPGGAKCDGVGVSFLGAGNYAKGILLPAVQACPRVRSVSVVTATGPSARRTAEKFSYQRCGTDPAEVFADPEVDLIFVATQHDSHAPLAEAALRAGKAVWLEKPAALDPSQLQALETAARETGGFLTLGYNRRFSSHVRAVRETFAGRKGPLAIDYTVAAGPTPAGTWHVDSQVGGGRVVGEVCHFVDTCAYLVGTPPCSVFARTLGRDPETDDSTVAMLGFPDGSTATVAYLARASTALPKERWEASADGRTVLCDNFRATRFLGGRTVKTLNQDKGQRTAVAEIVEAVRSGAPSPFELHEVLGVSRATFAILESARTGLAVDV